MDHNRATEQAKLSKAVAPDCSLCGRPLHGGIGEAVCRACKALKVRGYRMDTEDISGSKRYLAMDAAHFYEGYRACELELLAERMAAIGVSKDTQ